MFGHQLLNVSVGFESSWSLTRSPRIVIEFVFIGNYIQWVRFALLFPDKRLFSSPDNPFDVVLRPPLCVFVSRSLHTLVTGWPPVVFAEQSTRIRFCACSAVQQFLLWPWYLWLLGQICPIYKMHLSEHQLTILGRAHLPFGIKVYAIGHHFLAISTPNRVGRFWVRV